MRSTDVEWRRLVKWLKSAFPLQLPIYIRRKKKLKDFGYTYFDGNTIHIEILIDKSFDTMKDSLLHEYAHAVALSEVYSHKGCWGTLYGEIYQKWEIWNQ